MGGDGSGGQEQSPAALADSILGEPPAALRALGAGQLTELIGLLSLLR